MQLHHFPTSLFHSCLPQPFASPPAQHWRREGKGDRTAAEEEIWNVEKGRRGEARERGRETGRERISRMGRKKSAWMDDRVHRYVLGHFINLLLIQALIQYSIHWKVIVQIKYEVRYQSAGGSPHISNWGYRTVRISSSFACLYAVLICSNVFYLLLGLSFYTYGF